MLITTTNMGLFPLRLVLLPGERIPLHIFEGRYRALVADCVLEDRAFALPLATPEGIAKYACSARVERVEHRFADGRLNIIVQGQERVEILSQTEGEPYLTAEVVAIGDDDLTQSPERADEVANGFRVLAQRLTGAAADPPGDSQIPMSYRIAGAIQLPAAIKQRLLEERSEVARLRVIESVLDDALQRPDADS